jgi:hypothetical protein
MVRFILVDTTLPVRIRPRIEMSPVKGHFLSKVSSQDEYIYNRHGSLTDVSAVDSLRRCFES